MDGNRWPRTFARRSQRHCGHWSRCTTLKQFRNFSAQFHEIAQSTVGQRSLFFATRRQSVSSSFATDVDEGSLRVMPVYGAELLNQLETSQRPGVCIVDCFACPRPTVMTKLALKFFARQPN